MFSLHRLITDFPLFDTHTRNIFEQVCLNDTIVVNIINNLLGGEGVSIHWHGIHVPPHMDGVAMLTQCPIPEYSSFQYKYISFFFH